AVSRGHPRAGGRRRDRPAHDAVTAPALLCHPEVAARPAGFRARCPRCGSFWDREAQAAPAYQDDYPRDRGHFEPDTGRRKVESLARWLAPLPIELADQVACEIGFGGGHCLAWLRGRARAVHGIEVIPANLEHARGLGVPDSALHL